MDTIALQSTFRAPRNDSDMPESFLGTAIAGEGRLGRILEASPSESRTILARLQERLKTLEQLELERWQTERKKTGDKPVVLSRSTFGRGAGEEELSLVKSASRFNGRTYYYLTGEHLYRMTDEECFLNLSFDGVIVARPDTTLVAEKVSASAYAEFCGDRAGSLEPLATLTLRGRLYWIVSLHSEDGYDYGLFDPDANELVTLKGSWDLRR